MAQSAKERYDAQKKQKLSARSAEQRKRKIKNQGRIVRRRLLVFGIPLILFIVLAWLTTLLPSGDLAGQTGVFRGSF